MQVKQWLTQIEPMPPLGHGDEVVGASGPGDLADGECEAVRHSHGTGDDGHLVCLESSMHPPTWHATVDEIWSAVYLGVCPR